MNAPEREQRNKWFVLAICCLSVFVIGLDVSALNVAIPSMRAGLGASASQLQWILDAYTLVIGGLLMLSGSIADRVGRRLVLRIGLVIFGLGSMACAFAPTSEWLIAARVLQAVGGSMLNTVAMSIVINVFLDPRERARAIGIWGAVVGLSMALGPLVGGVLVQLSGWRSIFWVNVPVVVVAVVLCTLFVPESRAARPRRLDPVGQGLVMLMLTALILPIIEGRTLGWSSPLVLGSFAVALVTAVVLVLVELRVAEPLIDPRFFTSIPFSGAVLTAVVGFSAQSGFLFLNTVYLQTDQGLSPLQAGLMTVPIALCNVLFAPLSGRLVGSIGPRAPMLVAGVGIAASAAILTTVRVDTPMWVLLVGYVVFGSGFAMLNAPITNAAVSGMPRSQSGVASAVAGTSRQIGVALGVAVFGTLAFSSLGGAGHAASLAQAARPAWWVMFGCGIALLPTAVLVTSDLARRTSAGLAEE